MYFYGVHEEHLILKKTQLTNIQMHQAILVLLANQFNRQFQTVQLTILGMSILQYKRDLL